MAAADTIFALASGAGPAGIAVLRISGPRAHHALSVLSGREAWTARRATRLRLRNIDGEHLDHAMGLWFPRPSSFTGEDVAELHVHGGRAVVAGVLAALAAIDGLRPAEAGEFARRAFEHGKLDLTQAEALADLVAAETAAQRRQALRQLDGALGGLYQRWRQQLIGIAAQLEAAIDFSDEDLPDDLMAKSCEEAAALRDDIGRHLGDGGRGERIREGFSVVLIGAPNAGKSTLLNALVGREAAIVDAAPGTTRDVVEVPMDLNGMPAVFADTAGLREVGGRVEREGVRRARARAVAADLRIAVFDGERWPDVDAETLALVDGPTIFVASKGDLRRVRPPAKINGYEVRVVSALTGGGLPDLLNDVAARLSGAGSAEPLPVLTRRRHRQGVQACYDALDRFQRAAGAETAAEELRTAAAALGRIVGVVDVEEVLDAIFREFCIGK